MKYKIKITTFENGRKEYTALVLKKFLWIFSNWKGIHSDGSVVSSMGLVFEDNDRRSALHRIDRHYEGNCKVTSIEFEYITK